MARRRRKRLVLVPRLGPPRNLRPGGAHTPRTVYRRTQEKAALRREIAAGGFARFRRTDG